MIKRVELTRFKKYKKQSFTLNPTGVTLLVGGNNSGKSTLIQALTVWEFCKSILLYEKGRSIFNQDKFDKTEGLGLSAEDFLPIAVPSLNHLWTNLKTQLSVNEKKEQQDKYPGYIMRIKCSWESQQGCDRILEIGLSLVNDRLFIRVTDSDLTNGDNIPSIAYLPTFAGVLPRENKITLAERQSYLGKGMGGSIIRNMIYDLYLEDQRIYKEILSGKTRLSEPQKNEYLKRSPLERLQNNLREIFRLELVIEPFKEEFHTVLRINERKVTKHDDGSFEPLSKSKYTPRDIISQGSGFLQWLSVFGMRYSSNIDVLILDEPDAHLHASLQRHLFNLLCESEKDHQEKQILISTHSVEMIQHAPLEKLYSMDEHNYLNNEQSRSKTLSGIGTEYFPLMEQLKKNKRMIILENQSDKNILIKLSHLCEIELPENIVYFFDTNSHQKRKTVFEGLQKFIPSLRCISLRDRDMEPYNQLDKDLEYKGKKAQNKACFLQLTWRRKNIESYLICPRAISSAAKKTVDEIKTYLQTAFALAVEEQNFIEACPPEAIMSCDGKLIFTSSDRGLERKYNIRKYDVIEHMTKDDVCEDIKTFLIRAKEFFS